jgi:hypothetical protein
VAGRGVHEAGAGIVGDVVASEQRDIKIIIACETFERMLADEERQVVRGNRS